MGKQRRERRRPHKQNPTGLPSVKDFEEAETEEIVNEDRETALQGMYDDIQSPNIEERLNGLQILESMSCDSELAVQIAKDGITKMVGPLLIDHNIPVRTAAATALRFLADNGKFEAYEQLVKDDIMTPLVSVLKGYHTEWQPKQGVKEKDGINDEKMAFIQSVTLLWTLCENNDSAVRYSNEEDLVSVLIKFFDVSTYGIDVATVVAQCLLSLSEDNPTAIKKLREYESPLVGLLNLEAANYTISEIISMKTPVAGLLINLSNSIEVSSMSVFCKVASVLSEVLAVNYKQYLDNVVSVVPYEKNAFSASAKKKVNEAKRIFGAQQQALEILANMCDDEEDENLSDIENSGGSDCETEDMVDEGANEKSCKVVSSLPPEIIEVFSNCGTVEKVWQKTTAIDKDVVEILEQNVEGKAILKQIHTLRCRANLCLNNLIFSLEVDALGGTEAIYRMWMELGAVVFKDADSNDIELLESATAAMRAVLQKLSEEKANIFKQLTLSDIEPMLNGERQCANANVRSNLIRILGNLAIILLNSGNPESNELIKQLSIFLLDTCTVESEAYIIAECLDTIMDLYSEDETDHLAAELELINKLNILIPHFKNKVRQQRKSIGDNWAVVSTVNANIMRFVKYKGRRIKSN